MQYHGDSNIKSVYYISSLGFLLSLALILSYIESLIPFGFGIPGIKIGLPNLCTVIILYMWGAIPAILVNCMRIVLSGFLFGNLSTIIYSLAGATVSFIGMFLLKKTNKVSIGGVSLIGGVMHNIGQCLLACIIVLDYRVSFYLPVLIVVGAITGMIIGYISGAVIPYINRLWRK